LEQRLFAVGIETYAQLASTPVAKLREVLGRGSWKEADLEMWKAQAREFAETIALDALPYRLEEIKGIGPTYVQRLNEAGIHTFGDLAQTTPKQLQEIIQIQAWQAVDFGEWIKQAKLFSKLRSGDRPALPLEEVKGIGPAFAARLAAAGIQTFEELAGASEEQLQAIIGSRGMRVGNVARWIAQAKELMHRSEADLGNGEKDAAPTFAA
jgi:predicted flap endonuclease-1-like 5' DNA nuclease